MSSDLIIESTRDGVRTIQFNRPKRRNAFNPEMLVQFRTSLILAGDDPAVHTIVLRGDDHAFTVGADMPKFDDTTSRGGFFETYDLLPYPLLLTLPKTIVSVVEGMCVAAGVVIACASDIVVAASGAQFSAPQAKVGLADPFSSALLGRAIGTMRTSYLLNTGAAISGQTAHEWGLAAVLADPDGLDEALSGLLEQIAGTSPDAREEYKRMKNQSLPSFDLTVLARTASTKNSQEGRRAFARRSQPRFGPLVWQDATANPDVGGI